ncbi:MAG TPA: nucleotidyltransferase family protein [Steroidobacteraceae bacterium]|nr:nucleotidyltransferase family protein [Steroidobacteraceae bacterium]
MNPPDALSLHVVVLAAGASTRFGSPKQLVRVNGRPLLHWAVSRAVELAGQAVTVVLGANAAELAPLLRHTPAAVIVNRDWNEGMGSSVRFGISRVPATADAVLLMLADQPAVTIEDLRRLEGTWRRQPQSIVAAHYNGVDGVPAVFPREDFTALANLRGDAGARTLIRRGGERVVRVPLQAAAIDIDTPEDLLHLQN